MSATGLPRTLQQVLRPHVAVAIGLAMAGGVLITFSNSLLLQLGAIGGLAILLLGLAMTRAGIVLNPAWPIVAWLYLLGPIHAGAALLGFELSPGVAALLAIAPFPILAAMARPRILAALPQLLPLALLGALALASLAWSSAPTYGLSKLTLWVTTCVIPAAFIVVLARATAVSWGLIAGAGLAYVVALILVGADTTDYPGRVTIFGANPIWVGRGAVIVAIVGLFGPFRWPIRLLLLAAGTVGAVLTGSSGPLVGLVAGVLAGAGLEVRRRGASDWRALLAVVALLGVAVMLLGSLLLGILDPVLDEAVRDPNNLSRPKFLVGAAAQFAASPLIGSGLGGFASTGLDLYPHNLVAEVAAELGVLGILALGTWIFLAARASIRSTLLTALIVATLTFAMFSGNIAGEAEFWFFSALALGLAPRQEPARASLERDMAAARRSLEPA